MLKVRVRNGRVHWRWIPPAWPCRVGLHFMAYSFLMDGYCCPCRKIHLWNEDLSR
jgi:hypothetical protein